MYIKRCIRNNFPKRTMDKKQREKFAFWKIYKKKAKLFIFHDDTYVQQVVMYKKKSPPICFNVKYRAEMKLVPIIYRILSTSV